MSGSILIPCRRVTVDKVDHAVSIQEYKDRVDVVRLPATTQGFGLAARLVLPPDVAGQVEVEFYRAQEDGRDESLTKYALHHDGSGAPVWAWINFKYLRVFKLEPIVFGVRWRIGGGRWKKAATASVDVRLAGADDEDRSAVVAQLDQLPPLG